MSELKYTSADLKEMQAWPLERKIQVTQTRIIEWYQKFNGQVYVSFSGGKDSTVLLDIARRLYPDIQAVFCDTGLEYPEIREFVKTKENVVWLKPKMNFRKVIETYGYPLISKEVAQKIHEARLCPTGYASARFDPNSTCNQKYKQQYSMAKWKWLRDSDVPISHYCCDVMKKRPAKSFEKASGLHPIVATMAVEGRLRATKWKQYGCNTFDTKRPISRPMSFWTEQDVLLYIHRYNLPIVLYTGTSLKIKKVI